MNQPIRYTGETQPMTCFDCGQDTLVPGVIEVAGERYGESFSVQLEGLRCEKCGFQSIDSKQSVELTRLVSDAYRACHGLLSGAQIRECRSRLGMTQHQFSDYLGVGIASVKRWELGQIQDKAMDELIRLKTDPTAARENLKALEQQVPEVLVLFDGEDVSMTLAMGDTHYVHGPAMKIETVAIPEENEFATIAGLAA